MSATGWRRLIGSPKLQIIFHKRAIKYRSLLRKMTCKDKGSYESSPPCNNPRRDPASGHAWKSRVANLTEWYHAFEWVLLHTWVSHGAHMNVSCSNMNELFPALASEGGVWRLSNSQYVVSLRNRQDVVKKSLRCQCVWRSNLLPKGALVSMGDYRVAKTHRMP